MKEFSLNPKGTRNRDTVINSVEQVMNQMHNTNKNGEPYLQFKTPKRLDTNAGVNIFKKSEET
jgi:hypothetical protein